MLEMTFKFTNIIIQRLVYKLNAVNDKIIIKVTKTFQLNYKIKANHS